MYRQFEHQRKARWAAALAQPRFSRLVSDADDNSNLPHVNATKSAKEYAHTRDAWEEVFAVEFVSADFVEEADARAWVERHVERWNRDRPKWFVKCRDGSKKTGGVPDTLRDALHDSI